MRIAISTGGGDAPGLNAVIRAAVLSAINRGWEVLGIKRGFAGLLGEDEVVPLTKESVRTFESLLKDRPEDASLLNALGYSLADRNQKLPRAETLIRKALASSPDNPAFLDSLGWVRFRRGDVAGALPHLERAYRIYPDAEIASHWGELLWVSGKQSEARALWARSLARSPDSKPLRATIERLTGTKMDPPEHSSGPALENETPLPEEPLVPEHTPQSTSL